MARARHKWDPICDPPARLVRPVRVDPTGVTGPTPAQARGPHWRQTSRGYYVPAAVDPAIPEQRVLEQSVLLPPHGAVTGWGALRLRGGRFFDGLEDDGRTGKPVLLAAGPHQSRRKRLGVQWTQDRLAREEWSLVQGIRAALPERALFDEVRRAGSIVAAVQSYDMAFAAELTSLSRMGTYLETHGRCAGVLLARQAYVLADEASRSPLETRVRVVWVVDARLPRPQVNRPVFDRRTWKLLGIADLLDPEAGVVGEVDGGEHAGTGRRSRDAARDGAFRNHGLETFRITSADEHQPGEIRRRIRDAYGRARLRPAAGRTWTLEAPPWWPPERPLDAILTERELVRDFARVTDAEAEAELRRLVGPRLS